MTATLTPTRNRLRSRRLELAHDRAQQPFTVHWSRDEDMWLFRVTYRTGATLEMHLNVRRLVDPLETGARIAVRLASLHGIELGDGS